MMKKQDKQQDLIMTTLDQLVPEDSIYRLIDKYVDFEFIYEIVEPLYSNIGRGSIDPLNIFKIELINILEGYNSFRKTCRKVNVDVEYRWFLNLPFSENAPDHSTLSKVYERKFSETGVYEAIFLSIMDQIKALNLLNTKNVYIDGTHIKACANKRLYDTIEVDKPENVWHDEILELVNESRRNDGMKEFEHLEPEKTKTIKVSKIDPDCGYYVKGEKEKQMAYVAQVVCDENGYALDCEVVPGNVHDSQSCKGIIARVLTNYEVEALAADAGYKTGPIADSVISRGALFFTAYKRPMTKPGFFKSYEFVYDEYFNQILCPNNKILNYKRTGRNSYKIYESDESDCSNCEFKYKCTSSNKKQVLLSVFHDVLDDVEDMRHSDRGREVYKLRKEKIERLFADWKEKYGMRYLRLRGKERVRNHILLSLTCMNIKKMAIHLNRREKYGT